MGKEDIKNREDVYKLVSTFYGKVRNDEFLGPFFNRVIKDWEAHIDRLTTFWESSLFMTKKLDERYVGNPLEVHVRVDQENDHTVTEMHFGVWLNLWIQTIDSLFEGEVADNA
ncbi:MAG TPA: group III truncated hemoglobin, partial [Aquaticitalea sp.]|nr:group III truncated hemoglobin [Aquaticitalea sp.]